MTCIVGTVAPNGAVYIGGDSAGVDGYDLQVRADEKVFRRGEMLIGFSGSFRMGQALHYSGALPSPPKGEPDLMGWMVRDLVGQIRQVLIETKVASSRAGELACGDVLVGLRGRLFIIEPDYQVGEAPDGVLAIGCGAQVALGAMYATANHAPRARIQTALEAAERYCAGVRAPFHIKCLRGRR